MIGGPIGAGLHFFPLQWAVKHDEKDRDRTVNVGACWDLLHVW
jgi:hypothetical protein